MSTVVKDRVKPARSQLELATSYLLLKQQLNGGGDVVLPDNFNFQQLNNKPAESTNNSTDYSVNKPTSQVILPYSQTTSARTDISIADRIKKVINSLTGNDSDEDDE